METETPEAPEIEELPTDPETELPDEDLPEEPQPEEVPGELEPGDVPSQPHTSQ
jgi:hypothetical protein